MVHLHYEHGGPLNCANGRSPAAEVLLCTFLPKRTSRKGLAASVGSAREGQPTWVAELVDAANSKLDRDMGIGPSYFIGTDQDVGRRPHVRRIWRRAVIPYIEEQCFGDEDKLKQFDYDRLKRELNGAAPELDSSVAGPDGVGVGGQRQQCIELELTRVRPIRLERFSLTATNGGRWLKPKSR